MRDFLLCFVDEKTAHLALDPLGYGSDSPSGWDDDRVLRVTLSVAVDGMPIPDPRFWLVISLPETSDALYAIPACMREADREKALAGLPYVVRERFTAAQLAVAWTISPQWAGVDYSNAGAASGPGAGPQPADPQAQPQPDLSAQASAAVSVPSPDPSPAAAGSSSAPPSNP